MRSSNLLHRELQNVLKNRVSRDAANLYLYSRDMMPGITLGLRKKTGKRGARPTLPHFVCWPETVEEVEQIVRIANHHRVPVIPFGAGSGVLGGTSPVCGGIMIDMKRMNRILKIDSERFTADIETGKLGLQLEQELNTHGFTLGHFPSSIMCSTLGGYLATRSAGQMSSRYGKIEDMVEEIEVITPQVERVGFGKKCRLFPKINPKDLFIGTEGTCGIITKARLKLHPLPPAARYRAISFNRLENGLAAIRHIMQSGLQPSVVRLYDPIDTLLFQHGSEPEGILRKLTSPLARPLRPYLERLKQEGHAWFLQHPQTVQLLLGLLPLEVVLILDFEGDEEFIEKEEKMALDLCTRFIARDLGPELGDHWLKHRYSVSFKMPQVLSQEGFLDTIEVAATWNLIPTLYQKIAYVLRRKVLLTAHFSHTYPEGCSIYFTFAGMTGSYDKDYQIYQEVWQQAMEICLEVGGTISHHHGIGLLKAPYLERELGSCMGLFRQFKNRLDPLSIMNPGKMGL